MSRPLIYGRTYRIQNGYGGNGGYLDTRGRGCMGNKLCVSTAASFDRDNRSGSWVISSATGKTGEVIANDVVYLLNQYKGDGGDGGYLDTCGRGCQDNRLCVSTAASSNRDSGSGSWLIIPEDASTGRVMEDGVVRLLNGYAGFSGGFLDTRGRGCQDNELCVSTADNYNRDGGSTTWKFQAQ